VLSTRRLSDVGEFGLLAELERHGLVTRIEHDAAAFGGGLVVSQDALVDRIHFRLDWTSWRDVGYKAAAVNLSDLAASGAEALGLLVTLAAPRETAVTDILDLYAGLNEPGVPVVGGDTAAADTLMLSVTAVGRSARVPGRAGARPGDVLVVTGPLGASAAGFVALSEGLDSGLIRAHLRPPLRLAQGVRLGAVANAMLDVSDGLAADAAHLAERSACRLVVELERVLVPEGVFAVAERAGRDPWSLVCGFGEDYELLAAVPREHADGLGFARIGRCLEGEGVELLLGGRALELRGWDHFRGGLAVPPT
jgi:thiamine-monophosphate kinase